MHSRKPGLFCNQIFILIWLSINMVIKLPWLLVTSLFIKVNASPYQAIYAVACVGSAAFVLAGVLAFRDGSESNFVPEVCS